MTANDMKPEKINALFTEALCSVTNYIHDFNVSCSKNILFVGFNENESLPLQLWYNKSVDSFCISFSVYYMKNPIKKIRKYFIRSIISTNTDGTFKSFNEILTELKKIDGEYLESTLMNDYLASNSKNKKNPNVICKSCKKSFLVSDDMFNDINNYICDCGGELVDINNYEPTYFAKKNYISGKYRYNVRTINIDSYTDDFFVTIPHTDNDLDEFILFLQGKTKLTKALLLPELIRIIDSKEENLLKMYNYAFPSVYKSCYNSLTDEQKEYVNNTSPIAVKKKNTKQLNRKDFPCTDEEFEVIVGYNENKHCSRNMRPLLTQAIETNNKPMVESLIIVDRKSCKALQRYLKLTDRQYLTPFFKEG